MNEETQPLLIAIAIIIVISIAIYVISEFVSYVEQKNKEKLISIVQSTSERYQNILALNSKYDFYEVQPYYYFYKSLNSKTQLDRFDYDEFFEERIREDKLLIETLVSQVEENQKLFRRYNEEIHDWVAPLRGVDFTDTLKVSFEKYHEYEEEFVSAELLTPTTTIVFICQAIYTSPKGRNSYSGKKAYTVEDLQIHKQHIEELEKQKETKEYQRRMMTQSLRYDIMKRDNFRCVLCGRGAEDGVKLHVDHIIPVSKGGKTVRSNLRTLCEDCNIGKWDKYDEDGIN